MVVRPTCNKLKEWIIEEKAASRMYNKYGFKNTAKDESRHSRQFSKLLHGCPKGGIR
jgi:hypothetical protein